MFLLLLSISGLLSALAAPIASCSDQLGCMGIKFTEHAPAKCNNGNCEYEVCISILDGAAKAGCPTTISHVCTKSAECGAVAPFSSKVEPYSTAVNGPMCQRGGAGSKLYFIIKDGAGCDSGSSKEVAAGSTEARQLGLPDSASLACQGTTASPNGSNGITVQKSCSGDAPGQVGEECLWTVTLPTTCKGVCTDSTQCKNGAQCKNGNCDCTTGWQGDFCENPYCPTYYKQWPGSIVVHSGDVPGCSFGQARQIVDKFECNLNEECNVLKCDKPVPPAIVDQLKGCGIA